MARRPDHRRRRRNRLERLAGRRNVTNDAEEGLGIPVAVRFIWPVLGKPWVTRNFWFKDPLYVGGQHAAVDLIRADANVDGTPIVAIADGDFVAFPGLDRYSGYNGYIQHADGWRSGYRHMQRQPTSRRVKQGDVIGAVGTTGASTGPHLHFDLWNATPQSNRVFYKVGFYAHDPEEFLGREIEEDEMQEITVVQSQDASNKAQLIWTPEAGFRPMEFADALVIQERVNAGNIKRIDVKIPQSEWAAAST